jgi:hypothetical protein
MLAATTFSLFCDPDTGLFLAVLLESGGSNKGIPWTRFSSPVFAKSYAKPEVPRAERRSLPSP